MSYNPTTRILNQCISRGIMTIDEIAQILSKASEGMLAKPFCNLLHG